MKTFKGFINEEDNESKPNALKLKKDMHAAWENSVAAGHSWKSYSAWIRANNEYAAKPKEKNNA